MWVIIIAIAIGIIGVVAIIYAVKEKSKAAAWAGAFALFTFAFGLIFGDQFANNISSQPQTTNSLEASNNEANPLEAPKDYTPVFASYQENNGKYEITVRLSFYADTVEVTYSKPQDEVNYHSVSLSLNKIGEKTWVGTLDKQEVNANLDSISVASEKDNLTIYYNLKLDGQKRSLPAENDIVVFNPEVNVAEIKRDSFVQLKYTTNIQMKRAEGFYYDKDNNQIKFGLNSDDGYSWTPTQTIDKNNVSWNIYVLFFDNKDIQYTKKH